MNYPGIIAGLSVLAALSPQLSYAFSCDPIESTRLESNVSVPNSPDVADGTIIWRSSLKTIKCRKHFADPTTGPLPLQLRPWLEPLPGNNGFEIGFEYNQKQYWPGTNAAISTNVSVQDCSGGDCPDTKPLTFGILIRKKGSGVPRPSHSYGLFQLGTDSGLSDNYTLTGLEQIRSTPCSVDVIKGAHEVVNFGTLQNVDHNTPPYRFIATRKVTLTLKKSCPAPLSIAGYFRSQDGYIHGNAADRHAVLRDKDGNDSGITVRIDIDGNGEFHFERLMPLANFKKTETETQNVGLNVNLHRGIAPLKAGPFRGTITINLVYQ